MAGCPWSCAMPASESRRRTSSGCSSQFTQLDATLARRFEGAGLGLHLPGALIAGHGGELSLRSVPDAGTTPACRPNG
jgi:signal transduction histidine kinase